jgi:hypothetical protein
MKFSEKAEEANATFKSRCKQGVKPRFTNYERSTEEAGKCRKKATPFSSFFRHIPKLFAEKVCTKSHCLARRFEFRRPFSAFSENHLGFTGSRIPSQRVKMPVTMRPEKQGQRPEQPTACEPSAFFAGGFILKKILKKFMIFADFEGSEKAAIKGSLEIQWVLRLWSSPSSPVVGTTFPCEIGHSQIICTS